MTVQTYTVKNVGNDARDFEVTLPELHALLANQKAEIIANGDESAFFLVLAEAHKRTVVNAQAAERS